MFQELGHPVIAPLPRPASAEIGLAEETLEAYVHNYLIERLGENLERTIAVDLYRALRAVGTFTLRPRVSVCVGDLMRKVDVGDGRGPQWVVLDGKDGCGRVFRGRSASCRECQDAQTRRRESQLAEWRQNTRGLLEHAVFFPDGTTGIVRAGPCSKCGTEFQATDLRRVRCDRCRARHR